MKFVDEASIKVQAGNGGDGCISFRREKCVPRGGPDGGNGGDGGSIYLIVDAGLNTLADFRHQRIFHAVDGKKGRGSSCHGKSALDLKIKVPLGTIVRDAHTGEVIGDMVAKHQSLLVAQGGWHGLGNVRFKSSRNRAPRQFTAGSLGESRALLLEMRLLAAVGLLGLPNAGKSTLIRAVSKAKPKVANYPFTTLYPNLGIVDVDIDQRFVIADIPGLVAGASSGVGLGIQFLKHLSRTHLLLHIVDIAMHESVESIAEDVRLIEQELKLFDQPVEMKPRWIVLNKIDLKRADSYIVDADKTLKHLLGGDIAVFAISAVTGEGCEHLMQAVYCWLGEQKKA